MGRALICAIIGFLLTAIVVAWLTPLIFQGANMEEVGVVIGAPLGFVVGVIGFIYGLISSRGIKQRKMAEQEDKTNQNNCRQCDINPEVAVLNILFRRRPLVGGAKFGLAVFCLCITSMVFMLIVFSAPSAKEIDRFLELSILDDLIRLLLFGSPILIGIAGLLTGVQKGRPVIGIIALIFTPVGFFLALGAPHKPSSQLLHDRHFSGGPTFYVKARRALGWRGPYSLHALRAAVSHGIIDGSYRVSFDQISQITTLDELLDNNPSQEPKAG